LGFADVMADCVINDQPCTRLDAQVDAALAALAPRLAEIDTQIRQRAPHATLIVVGYPQLVIDPAKSSFPTCAGITPDESRWVRQKGDQLNAAIRQAAQATGARYVDAATPFAGHEACSAQPWMVGVDLTNIVASFHPNALGQQELAKLVEAALPRR
jgi:lysophospholipase L1-like esterase